MEPLDDYHEDEDPSKITFRDICHGFGQHALYDKIMSAIKKLGIRPEEIRLDNTGISSDGKFVIIDSSIHEQIQKGFDKDSKPAVKKPVSVPAGKTQTF